MQPKPAKHNVVYAADIKNLSSPSGSSVGRARVAMRCLELASPMGLSPLLTLHLTSPPALRQRAGRDEFPLSLPHTSSSGAQMLQVWDSLHRPPVVPPAAWPGR